MLVESWRTLSLLEFRKLTNLHIDQLVFIIAFLMTIIVLPASVQPVSDSYGRFLTAHWLWTGKSPNGYIRGREGIGHYPTGIGQCLVMLPADIALSATSKSLRQNPEARFLIACYMIFPLINALAVLGCFKLLLSLQFSNFAAFIGCASLLFTSSFLWHCQNNQENPLELLLTVTGAVLIIKSQTTGHLRQLFYAALAFGSNMLVRIPTLADASCMFTLPLLVSWFDRKCETPHFINSVRGYLKRLAMATGPVFLVCGIIDRTYHWWRFGTIWNTYFDLLGTYARQNFAGVPASFPYSGNWIKGFLGPLISPGKSIFIYDPLIVVTLVSLVFFWKQLPALIKAFATACLTLLFITISGYARFPNWAGDAAWGTRYCSVPVHLLVLIALPLVIRFGDFSRYRMARNLIGISIALSFAIQLASLIFPCWVELIQGGVVTGQISTHIPTGLGNECYLGYRIANIIAELTGNFYAWGLDKPSALANQIGPPSPMLVPLLPFASLPWYFGVTIKTGWFVLLGLLVVCVRHTFVLSKRSHSGRH